MLEMYNQFRDFHVFKRFKYLLSDWWNIDILVLVKKEDKFFYDDISQLSNPVVKSLLSASLFKNYFLSSLNKAIKQGRTNPGQNFQILPWKQTGLNLLVLPLVLKNAPLEAFIVATGFSPKKLEKLEQALAYLDLSQQAILQKIENLKELTATDEIYIQKMLQILSEEFFTLLQERQKQVQLIEKLNHRGSEDRCGLMVGKSPAMQYIFGVLKKIKNSSANVLIEGEKGTGKRLLAQTIHNQSPRAEKTFHSQNFSTFKGGFLELELFGWSPSAFPQDKKGKKPLLEKIDGGTLFFNEIGSASPDFQKKLLSFLKDSVFFSEGDKTPKKANVRIISASSKSLKELVKEGAFNKELYEILNAVEVKLPALKNRKEDIPLLLEYFLKKKTSGYRKRFSAKALKALGKYAWPGNIRELENEVTKVLSLSSKDQTLFTAQDLSPHIQNIPSFTNFQPGKETLKTVLHKFEKQILLDCLRKAKWNKSQAAKMLGLSRTSIILKTKEYGIVKDESA